MELNLSLAIAGLSTWNSLRTLSATEDAFRRLLMMHYTNLCIDISQAPTAKL